jgi:mannose-6-phosphate isomerase
MGERLYPLTFEPVLRDYMWGGRRLERLYGRALPPGITAESWEVSAHPSSPTAVSHGPLRGLTLPEVVDRLGADLLGTNGQATARGRGFPLLVKLLDANLRLSVQVHPDDAYALAHEGGLGKTEMWYVLYAAPGAGIIYGLQEGVTRESFARAVSEGALGSVLRQIGVRAGDAICVPAGTVHALLSGLVVAEIQENSDTTYRVYDWDRPGPDGRPRPLHIARALEVVDFGSAREAPVTPELVEERDGVRVERLVACDQFAVERVRLEEGAAYAGVCDGSTFALWGAVEGGVRLEPGDGSTWPGGAVALCTVGWALLPAALGTYILRTTERCTLLRVVVPPR